MNKKGMFFIVMLALAALLFGYSHRAAASSSYYGRYCTECHGVSSTTTCAGCHAHGIHPDSSKNSMNITAATDKTGYQPGETVSVTVSGGYRSGWVRVVLYDQDMKELARSTGTVVSGAIAPSGGAGIPVTLQGPAPATPGTYAFHVSWYGNQFDKSGGFFSPQWRPDPNNPDHGEEIVATNSFTVVGSIPPPPPPPAPAITVTDSVPPATDLLVSFGSVNAGSSASQTVTVTNTGNASLDVGAVGSTNPLAPPFSLAANTCSNQTIAPAASCTLTVAFAPAATGAFTDSFNIPGNDPTKSSVTVNVSGAGASAPTPAISVTDSVAPATDLLVPFGSITAGTSSTRTVTVTNTGTASLMLGAVGSANPLAAPFSLAANTCSNQTIAPAASCTLTVAFAPAATGAFTDSFNIPSNDPTKSSVTVNVSGAGGAVPAPAITVTDSVAPTTDLLVPFGTVATGSAATRTVTVANTGNAPLVVGSVGATDPPADPFAITADTCSEQTIAPAASCTLTVAFAPVSTGTFADSFNIPGNDPVKASVTVSLSGTGASNATGDIQVTDPVAPADDLQVPFGNVRRGRVVENVVTVANGGSGELAIGIVGSGNPLAGPFSIASDNCSGMTLATGGSCTVTVRFSPPADCGGTSDRESSFDAAGTTNSCSFSDSFDIPSDDPDEQVVTVQVSGAGVTGNNNPPSKPRPRYPADKQKDLETSLTMRWEASADPDGDHVRYELRISKDESFSAPMNIADAGKPMGTLFAGTGLGFIFLGFVFAGSARGRKGLLIVAATVIIAGSALVGCGGGNVDSFPAPIPGSGATVEMVSQPVSGLETSTIYYWKVVASDGNGGVTESDVYSFTTE